MALNVVTTADDRVEINHVLISVFDKSGLDTLVNGLGEINPSVRIYSTGGTFARCEEILGERSAGTLTAVSEYTGQPEMQGGLVKTLDFKIYLGLLSETYNKAHAADLGRTGAVAFDMVVVNLYPFVQTVATADTTVEQGRAHIDIGGPCMLRAAAKNFLRVAGICDPGDYQPVLDEMESTGGSVSFSTRYDLAAKAFKHTAEYDAAVAAYLDSHTSAEAAELYRFQNSQV